MSENKITVSRKLVYGIGFVIFAVLLILAVRFPLSRPSQLPNAAIKGSDPAAGSAERFALLSGQGGERSIASTCGLQPVSVETMPDDARIQGSCCSRMDLHKYQEQVEGLKKYADIPQIPADPYDVPVSLAKQLFAYQKAIQLTPDQQAIYNQAAKLSENGGPCCCKCWRWTAFEGQAKYLITELDWSAEQIAELWDIQDGCGGPGHEHG